jgi:hypothetical protein
MSLQSPYLPGVIIQRLHGTLLLTPSTFLASIFQTRLEEYNIGTSSFLLMGQEKKRVNLGILLSF